MGSILYSPPPLCPATVRPLRTRPNEGAGRRFRLPDAGRHERPGGGRGRGLLAVYLQMSYLLGGYSLIVPRDRVERLDMSVENALQWGLTAGVSVSEDAKILERDSG